MYTFDGHLSFAKTMSLMCRKTIELPVSETVAGWRGEEGMHLITRS